MIVVYNSKFYSSRPYEDLIQRTGTGSMMLRRACNLSELEPRILCEIIDLLCLDVKKETEHGS